MRDAILHRLPAMAPRVESVMHDIVNSRRAPREGVMNIVSINNPRLKYFPPDRARIFTVRLLAVAFAVAPRQFPSPTAMTSREALSPTGNPVLALRIRNLTRQEISNYSRPADTDILARGRAHGQHSQSFHTTATGWFRYAHAATRRRAAEVHNIHHHDGESMTHDRGANRDRYSTTG